MGLLKKKAGLTDDQFRKYWLHRHAPVVLQTDQARQPWHTPKHSFLKSRHSLCEITGSLELESSVPRGILTERYGCIWRSHKRAASKNSAGHVLASSSH
jgi:hypothetical protein